jgi:release factor glutamine methyltransferase
MLAHQAQARLRERCGDTTRLEAELLLAYALECNRAQLFARYSQPVEGDVVVRFAELLERRMAGEPLAYITGHTEFYGLDLVVTPGVLIPRPETEQMLSMAVGEVVAAQRRARYARTFRVADIGTGSGAIAVALATRLPSATIFGVDISETALAIARINCVRHGLSGRIRLVRGDLLAPLTGLFDAILANLPYIRTGDLPTLQTEVRDWEPLEALDGGIDGLDHYRRFLPQAASYLAPGGFLICEIGYGQALEMRQLASRTFPRARVELQPDFAGIPRMLRVEAPGGR